MLCHARGPAVWPAHNLFPYERVCRRSFPKSLRVLFGVTLCGLFPICFHARGCTGGPFWTQFRPMSAAFSRQSSSPSWRGLGRATQDGPTEVQKKLSKKAFQKVFQATCRPDVQSTCPTSCSSRPATVERLIIIIRRNIFENLRFWGAEGFLICLRH